MSWNPGIYLQMVLVSEKSSSRIRWPSWFLPSDTLTYNSSIRYVRITTTVQHMYNCKIVREEITFLGYSVVKKYIFYYFMVQDNKVQYSAVQYSTKNTVQCSTVQYSTVLYCTVVLSGTMK